MSNKTNQSAASVRVSGHGPAGPGDGQSTQNVQAGVFSALAAYAMWGLFPLLFRMLDGVPAATIVAHRVVWSLVFVGVIIIFYGRMREVRAAMKDRRVLLTIFVASLFLSGNWLVYVWAVETQQVIATSFGYFINPLVNVLLGMVFLGERQNKWQWLAIGIAVIGVLVQAVGIGGVPIVSLVLAFSFGTYGFIRKTVNVGSAPGLMIETILLFPLALLYIGFTLSRDGAGVHADPAIFAWLVATGPATAGALLFFAFAARQLRLTSLGMIQYLAPSMHLLIAVYLFREPLNMTQLFSFVLIWVSLIIFSLDSLKNPVRAKI